MMTGTEEKPAPGLEKRERGLRMRERGLGILVMS